MYDIIYVRYNLCMCKRIFPGILLYSRFFLGDSASYWLRWGGFRHTVNTRGERFRPQEPDTSASEYTRGEWCSDTGIAQESFELLRLSLCFVRLYRLKQRPFVELILIVSLISTLELLLTRCQHRCYFSLATGSSCRSLFAVFANKHHRRVSWDVSYDS